MIRTRAAILALAAAFAAAAAAEEEAPAAPETGAAATPAAEAPAPPLRVTGSSTVAPFALVAAGLGGADHPVFVEATGTGAGLAAMCGPEQAPLASASRPIGPAEVSACGAAGVATIVEIELGLGAIVLAQSEAAVPLALTLEDLYRAVAGALPDADCAFAPNPNHRWSQVRDGLPDRPIRIYGPPATSGTRDILIAQGLAAAARADDCLSALEGSDPAAFRAALRLRRDGAWIDAGESDGATAYALTRLPDAVGILGRVHAVAQPGLNVLPLDGVSPDDQAIAEGRYPLARPLYLYTTAGTLTRDGRVRPFLSAINADGATGPEGRLTRMGLTPSPQANARLISTEDGSATPLALGL